MADNEWMYSGRISAHERTDGWEWKTNFFVKDLARGSKSAVRPLCPCAQCKRRQRQGKLDMTKHLWLNGYMPDFTMRVDFAEYERAREEVMRQRIDGNEDDGIRNMLDGFRDAAMPDLPPPEEGTARTGGTG